MSKFTEAMEGRKASEAPVVVIDVWRAAMQEEQLRLMAEFELLCRDTVQTVIFDNFGNDEVLVKSIQQIEALARTNGLIAGMNRSVEIYLSIFAD